MEVKVFRAANLQAALEEIRKQLGPGASVLRTRQCRDGWMGWLGRSYVEVTASTGQQAHEATGDPSLSTPGEASSSFPRRTILSARHPVDSRDTSHASLPLRIQTEHSPPPTHQPHARAFGSPETRFGSDARQRYLDPLNDYRTRLISLGVPAMTAERWIRATAGFVAGLDDHGGQSWQEQLARTVGRDVQLSGPIRLSPGERRVVALVGPTGVGKTTTVAKLAAGFRMHAKRRVGLVTIDTFRIAAVQQLQAYAQIMDLPMSVVESGDEMPGAIERLGDQDLILIDTAGRSPKGEMDIASLAEMLRRAQPDETHLVISATSSAAVVQSVLEGFSIARPTAAILTKLDETPYTAGVLAATSSSSDFGGIPISYVTNGQHVPDDISIATAQRLTQRLLPAAVTATQIEAA